MDFSFLIPNYNAIWKFKQLKKGVESFVDIFFYLVFEISKLYLRYYYAHWFFSSYDSRIYL